MTFTRALPPCTASRCQLCPRHRYNAQPGGGYL